MDKIQRYREMVKDCLDIESKGKTSPYTSVNGHMFSFITKEGDLGLRLSEEDRSIFFAKYATDLMEQHGRVMKEYVRVPETFFCNPEEIKHYFKASFAYVSSLKPKATKKSSAI